MEDLLLLAGLTVTSTLLRDLLSAGEAILAAEVALTEVPEVVVVPEAEDCAAM